ncbi:MAG: T9SS type A sorting domain-containing protein [Candidatus Cloacimonadaceae bacterium]|nr:T9SS type A sorting domain-containing protein [Candidatus Cloacimonadaceae bacterium]
MTIAVQRASDGAVGSLDNIIIPTGTTVVWWGRPGAYPGTPVILVPPTPTNYLVSIASTPIGVPIYLDGVPTGVSTGAMPIEITHPAGFSGTYTVVWPGYTWMPESLVITDLQANASVVFAGTPTIVNPNPAVNPVPTDGAILNWAWDAVAMPVQLAWNPGAGPMPDGYKLYWNGAVVPIDLMVNHWMTPAIGAGMYTWKVVPYIVDPVAPGGKRMLAPVATRQAPNTRNAQAPIKGDAVGAVDWAFTIVLDPPPPVYWDVTVTSDPVGAAIYVDGVDSGDVTPHVFPMLEGTDATYSVMMTDYTWVPASYGVTNIMNDAAIHFVGTLVVDEFDFEEGVPTDFGTVTITIIGGDADLVPGANIPGFPNGGFVPTEELVLYLWGAGPWTFTIETTAPWGAYYQNGSWHAFPNVLGFITFTITAAKDIPVMPIVLGPVDPTLPVELSGFFATLTAQNFVKLTWISQSESGLLGYRVYRNESNSQAGALMITPVMVPATNTSTTATYSVTDSEVAIGTTYWYWLESVDFNHSNFHGPVSVTVEGNVPPVLPEATTLKSAYPNPFKASGSVNIGVEIKAGDSGTVTIYNILGQAVKTFSVSEGIHNIIWNGKDSKGNACGSGIYFYKLSTPSMNQTRKMVIVK